MSSSNSRPPGGNVHRRLASILAMLALTVAHAAMAQAPSSSTPLPLNPLALGVTHAPQAFAAGDGRVHLTWEVQASNLTNAALPVRSIAVWADGGAQPLLEYKGADIPAHLTPLAQWSKPSDRIEASGAATLWLDLALDKGAPLPTTLETRVGVEGEGIAGADATTRVRVPVDATKPRVIRPPLAGKRWGVFEGCCDAANHHRRGQRSVDGRLVLPERYAIDFVQLDKDGNLFKGSDVLEHYYAFGKPVLAVADATVVDVYDELADVPPHAKLPPPSLPRAGGNHVILDLGDGVWAMYGHLKAHSIRVKVGDRVKAGEAIAQLGNNGNSDLPHLHFQLMDSRHFALSQGLPFVFDRYEMAGRADADGDHVHFDARPVAHENDLPLTLSIVDFAEPAGKGR